jgi:hypothetical protein
VQVTSPDLADLTIGGIPTNSRELRHFDDVWKALPALTDDVLERVLERWAAAHGAVV